MKSELKLAIVGLAAGIAGYYALKALETPAAQQQNQSNVDPVTGVVGQAAQVASNVGSAVTQAANSVASWISIQAQNAQAAATILSVRPDLFAAPPIYNSEGKLIGVPDVANHVLIGTAGQPIASFVTLDEARRIASTIPSNASVVSYDELFQRARNQR